MSARTYSSREVCDLVGVTYRQLDYWCRLGTIPGAAGRGSGTGRRWTAQMVATIAVVAAVAPMIDPCKLDRVARFLHGTPVEKWPATLRLAPDGQSTTTGPVGVHIRPAELVPTEVQTLALVPA